MKKLRFKVVQSYVGGFVDTAYVDPEQDSIEAVVETIVQDISTDLDIKIGDTTMFLAAWQDPEHWRSDWAEILGIEWDDVPEAVAAIIASAEEE